MVHSKSYEAFRPHTSCVYSSKFQNVHLPHGAVSRIVWTGAQGSLSESSSDFFELSMGHTGLMGQAEQADMPSFDEAHTSARFAIAFGGAVSGRFS